METAHAILGPAMKTSIGAVNALRKTTGKGKFILSWIDSLGSNEGPSVVEIYPEVKILSKLKRGSMLKLSSVNHQFSNC